MDILQMQGSFVALFRDSSIYLAVVYHTTVRILPSGRNLSNIIENTKWTKQGPQSMQDCLWIKDLRRTLQTERKKEKKSE